MCGGRLVVDIEVLDDGVMPTRAHEADACFDVYAREDTVIDNYHTSKLPLGFKMRLPVGWEAVIRPRSSSVLKKDVMVFIGTVDAEYTGEVVALVKRLHPTDDGALVIKRGASVAQMKIQKVHDVVLREVDEVTDSTVRGNSGFGSTDHPQ